MQIFPFFEEKHLDFEIVLVIAKRKISKEMPFLFYFSLSEAKQKLDFELDQLR